ncbi:hypothetical protein OE88DRAFT_1645925 [Heliocybe sulcata]|uniref:Uncharacterized protein n=1 Tax=Heliocybe sulcata TaxID=5364 RepID=A0A5C3MXF5_9AGAM|nr:hypothetical protein OE88DRAFT_1645925 [Heliocybe sulcata]
MPTAPVDSKGTELSFTDTGPVHGSDTYTTLVVLHGCGFPAEKDDLRLVVVNRRAYGGSTKYGEAELEELRTGQASFLHRIASELANFLVWLIDTNHIPPTSEDGSQGGICLMGWSLGNTSVMTLLAYPDVIPPEISAKLEQYLRKIVLYDPPHCVFGLDKPKRSYDPFEDPELANDPARAFRHFCLWATAYYSHRDLSAARYMSGLDYSKLGTNSAMMDASEEEWATITDGQAAANADVGMIYWMQPAIRIQTRNVLFRERIFEKFLPKVEITLLYGTASFWTSVFAVLELERQYGEHRAKGRNARPMTFFALQDSSHFAHWDEPERFWAAVVEAINTSSVI